MLVAHSNSSSRWRYTNWWISHKYCSNSHVSPNGGVTSSISDSEKSVVMFSFVSGAPSAAGWRDCTMSPAGETRSDSFSTPLRPPRSTPRSPELMSPARRRSNILSTTLRNTLILVRRVYGSSATTSISTMNPGSTNRCTWTHEIVGSRSLS